MEDTSRSETVSTKLHAIAEQAVRYPDTVFTTLMHHIDVEFLFEAFRRTRKDAAPGVDGVTAEEYAAHLGENLRSLHARMRSEGYKAPPVKRVWLDKEGGKKRPIGMPAFEDKIVQRAVTMLLESVYEQDFHDFSYGFRPGRSAHQAIGALRECCMALNTGWIVDADISGFFDNLDHGHLRDILRERVNDGGVLRFVGKWLNAGVLEGQELTHPEAGSPQGGVISPLLSNIYLHHVLDDWFVKEVQPRLQGRSFLIRYADDFVIGCECESDARRVLAVLPQRFGRYGLTIHPEKTNLVKFGKPGPKGSPKSGNGTFDFLGFTHYWATSRRGYWVIKRRTMRSRLKRAMKALWQWCRENMHRPIMEQHKTLCQKLRGHYQYYGLRTNGIMLQKLYSHARYAWRHWLSRRNRKHNITWEMFDKLMAKLPLPASRTIHKNI